MLQIIQLGSSRVPTWLGRGAGTDGAPRARNIHGKVGSPSLQGWEKRCTGNLHMISDGVERWLHG